VVKAGPLGAALVTTDGIVHRPASPVGDVVDPTGAGDGVAGGFLGHCASVGRDDDETFLDALDEGLRRAAAVIGTFGTTGLRALATGTSERS
jgi:sugar/nucleoside kinase (ribokinase family)